MRVWYQQPPFAHTKLLAVDGYYCQIGSANLDARSLRLNFELNMEVFNPDVHDQITAHIDRPFGELSPVEACVMMLGSFEMLNHPETPYRVIINEAIELTKAFGGTDGHKYVNGVLDKVAAILRPDEVAARKQAKK